MGADVPRIAWHGKEERLLAKEQVCVLPLDFPVAVVDDDEGVGRAVEHEAGVQSLEATVRVCAKAVRAVHNDDVPHGLCDDIGQLHAEFVPGGWVEVLVSVALYLCLVSYVEDGESGPLCTDC